MKMEELLAESETWAVKHVSDAEFAEIVEKAKLLNALGNEQRLLLYGLYKQATVGNVNISSPWSIDVVGKAKWDAWKSCEGVSKEKACLAYGYLVNVVIGGQDPTATSAGEGLSPSVSTMKEPQTNWSKAEEILKHVIENDADSLVRYLQSNPGAINYTSEEGLKPIHFASDRGHLEIVRILVAHNADINAVDGDQQTPLMLAAISRRKDVYEFLLQNGADTTIKNCDGETVADYPI